MLWFRSNTGGGRRKAGRRRGVDVAKRGRRPVLDQKKKQTICAILGVGGNRRLAAQYVGCSPKTIRRTAERDAEFAAELEHAESLLEVLHLKNMEAAAKETKYWRASAWFLERRCADRYGAPARGAAWQARLSQAVTEFAEIVAEEVPDEEGRARVLERMEALTTALEAEAEAACTLEVDE